MLIQLNLRQMKHVNTLGILVILLSSFTLSSQVVEKTMRMSQGEQNGLEVDLTIDKKEAEKLWKNYVKPIGKLDWDRKNKEHLLFNKQISSISSDPVTIVSKFSDNGSGSIGSFWFKVNDNYLSSTDDNIREAGNLLQEFAYEAERLNIRNRISTEEKGLSSLEKDLKKLMKKNEDLHNDIEKAKKTIADKEKAIEENLKNQENKQGEIEAQKGKIKTSTEELGKVGNNN